MAFLYEYTKALHDTGYTSVHPYSFIVCVILSDQLWILERNLTFLRWLCSYRCLQVPVSEATIWMISHWWH